MCRDRRRLIKRLVATGRYYDKYHGTDHKEAPANHQIFAGVFCFGFDLDLGFGFDLGFDLDLDLGFVFDLLRASRVHLSIVFCSPAFWAAFLMVG